MDRSFKVCILTHIYVSCVHGYSKSVFMMLYKLMPNEKPSVDITTTSLCDIRLMRFCFCI